MLPPAGGICKTPNGDWADCSGCDWRRLENLLPLAREQDTWARKAKRKKKCTTHCTTLLPLFVLMCIYPCVLVSFCVWRASVLDVNDETPTFNPRVYNVSLKESVPRDHTVARLSCFDNDAGLNAELSYFITGQRSRWEVFFCVLELKFLKPREILCATRTFLQSIHACESLCMYWAPLHVPFTTYRY